MKEIEVKNKNSCLLKFIGLIDRRIEGPIFFMTRFGIHTFFMKNPIQLLILDENDVLIKSTIVEPNRVYFWNPYYHRIVEIALITGEEELDIKVGEKLLLEFV